MPAEPKPHNNHRLVVSTCKKHLLDVISDNAWQPLKNPYSATVERVPQLANNILSQKNIILCWHLHATNKEIYSQTVLKESAMAGLGEHFTASLSFQVTKAHLRNYCVCKKLKLYYVVTYVAGAGVSEPGLNRRPD